MPTGGVDVLAGSVLAEALGTTAAGAIGSAALGGEIGAGIGGLEGLVTGGNPFTSALHGAEGGALTGGGIGLIGGPAGFLPGTIGDIAGGAGGGALNSFIQGNNPLVGAAEGAAAGGIASLNAPSTTNASGGSNTVAVGPTAASSAAPVGVVGDTGDVSNLSTGGTIDSSGNLVAGGTNTSNFTPSTTTGVERFSTPDLQSAAIDKATGAQAGDVSSFLSANSPSKASANAGDLSPADTNFLSKASLSRADTNFLSKASGGDTSLSPADTNFLSKAGATTAGATTAGAHPASSGAAFLDNPGFGTFKDMLIANPGAAVGAAGIGADALKNNQMVKGQRQIQNTAGQLGAQGQALQGYLQTGTLPPGVQGSINQAAEAQKASIRSRYANEGGSGSSAMQTDLAAVDAWAKGQGTETALKLLDTGINESALSATLYQDIAKNSLEQDNALGSAISKFASSLAG